MYKIRQTEHYTICSSERYRYSANTTFQALFCLQYS